MIPDIDKLLGSPEFGCLDDGRKAVFREIFAKVRGKSSTEAVMLIMNEMRRLPEGKEISRDEKRLMAQAFINGMPENERNKYQKIISMFIK